jgi:hypothetical protein
VKVVVCLPVSSAAGDFARGDVGFRHQQVDQRGLAHAGLADQDRRLAGQQRQQASVSSGWALADTSCTG